MGSVSFDASLKVTKSSAGGYFKHLERNGKENVRHSNENIDPSLSRFNQHYRVQNQSGSERLNKFLNAFEEKRLAFNASDYKSQGKRARRPLNENSVVIRGLVFAPPAEAFQNVESMKDKQKIMNKFTRDVFAWYEKQFDGLGTVVVASVHLDETSPHLHIAMCPMTKDGRISQKDFFKSPAHMKAMHKNLREHLNERGWNVDTKNKYVDAKHYNDKEYKENAEEIELVRGVKKKKYDAKMEDINATHDELQTKLQEAKERKAMLDQRQRDLTALANGLSLREEELKKKEEELKLREESFQVKLKNAQKKYKSVDFGPEM